MHGKRLITSFFVANLLDAAVTFYFLGQEGWLELNGLAAVRFAEGRFFEILILKIAFTAVLIGAYAVAKACGSRLHVPLEKSLRVGSLLVWSVQVWNAVNILAALPLMRG